MGRPASVAPPLAYGKAAPLLLTRIAPGRALPHECVRRRHMSVGVVATASVVGDAMVEGRCNGGYGVVIISSGNHKLTVDSPRRRD